MQSKFSEIFKEMIKSEILGKYRTIEEFCYVNDLAKGTYYRFFAGKQDITFKTLCNALEALPRKIEFTENKPS